MSLARKNLLVITLTLIGLVVVLYVATQAIMLQSYIDLEARDARDKVKRVEYALSKQIDDMAALNEDWAAWDDTYAYVQKPNDTFITQNVYDKWFVATNINLIAIANLDGQLVYNQMFDLQAMKEMSLPADFKTHFAPGGIILRLPTEQSKVSGIILLDGRPLRVVSRPILTSTRQGPVMGTLVFGRYLDQAEIDDLSSTTRLAVSLHVNDDPQLPADVRSAQTQLTASAQIAVQPLNADAVAGYTTITDLYGKPIATLKVESPREIYQQGQQGVRYFVILLVISGVIFGVVSLVLLQTLIFSRLSRLSADVDRISVSGAGSERLPIQGRDEVSSLGNAINRMLEVLWTQQQQLQAILDNATALIFTRDASGKYITLNKRYATLLHLPEKTATKTLYDVYPPALADEISATDRQVMDTGQPIAYEQIIAQDDGDHIYLTVKFPLYDATGKRYAVSGIATDITERKLAEKQIRAQNEALLRANQALAVARKQAEDATRLKSEFLSTMSHELRTPLNAVIGYTEILLAGMSGELNDEQRDFQERILANGVHLLNLINEVLDLSKIEAGRLELMRQPFSPRDLLNEVVYQTKGLLTDKSVQLEATLDEQLPPSLMGDYGRVKQTIINLVSNAVKFTEHGTIQVMIKQNDPLTWSIIVRDTGIGIPPHALEYIFEEFRQVDGTSQRKHGGTGLGLAITRKLILKMNGTIQVKSNMGEGSTFTITLPLITEAEPVLK